MPFAGDPVTLGNPMVQEGSSTSSVACLKTSVEMVTLVTFFPRLR